MKRIFLSLIVLMTTMSINAQVIKVYKNGCTTPEVVFTNTATDTYRVEFEEAPHADPNLLPGKFSVSATKQVQFTKSNIYWRDGTFKFEETQITTSPETYYFDEQTNNTTTLKQVSHFSWTNATDYNSNNPDYMPYNEGATYSSQSTDDKFWCGEDNPLTIDGTDNLYVLTGGNKGEWTYLFNKRANHSSLYKCGVTVDDATNCLIIAPDDFEGELKSSYSLEEINKLGLVCLPAAGFHNGSAIIETGNVGYYWTASPRPSESDQACRLYFYSGNVFTSNGGLRDNNYSIRLVRTCDASQDE